MKKFILLLLPTILLQSCFKFNTDEKSTPTVVDFTFRDYYNNDVIANMKVCMTKQRGLSITASPTYVVDTFVTNENGNITFAFQNEQSQIYNIAPVNNNETDYGGFEEISLSTGLKNSKTVQVRKINHLKVILNDKTHSYQKVRISFGPELLPYTFYEGNFKDTVIIFKCLPETSRNSFHINLDNKTAIEAVFVIPKVDTFTVSYDF